LKEALIKYNPIHIIKDQKFDIELLSRYNLYISFDFYAFTLCVVDTQDHRCVRLESYLFEDIVDIDDYIEQLDAFYDNHHFLKVQFWNKVIVSVKNNAFSLVPKSLFKESEALSFLQPNTPIDLNKDAVVSGSFSDIVTVFSLDKKIANWFTKSYLNSNFLLTHHSLIFLESIMHEFALEDEQSLYINVDITKLTIVLTSKSSLAYCNVLDFYSSEELIQLIQYVATELKLNLDTIETIIWLNSEADVTIVEQLKDYFGNLYLGTRPYSLNFGYNFDEIADYQFFDSLSIHCCA